ncbi:MAG TPA: sigma-70 family RNA polymerase sigma factor [Ktedonobacteraceae bacterium]|nr:sigma-70 family RNA polymerase sigma factor [Ktedonobacteraceae bacterium]
MQQTTHANSMDGSMVSQLYQCHAPALLTHLRINLQSREDAEDLLVDAFVTAQEYEEFLNTLSKEEQRKWLWRVTRNKMIDLYRRSQAHKGIPLEEATELLYDDERTPEGAALQQDEYKQLHDNLQRLSAQQQELLRLRFVNGLRCNEIATIMGKGHGAVRAQLSRTLNLLRNIYAKEEANYE